MTGYGRGAFSAGGLHVEVEISSVNRKQLDVLVNLPQALRLLESRIQDEVAKALSRGRVVVEVAVHDSGTFRGKAVRFNEELASQYLKVARTAAGHLGVKDDVTLSHLMSLPGVVHHESVDEDTHRIWPLLLKALREALSELLKMRSREGEALAKDLGRRLGGMRKELVAVLKRAPQVSDRYRAALHSRLQKAGLDIALDDERLMRELVLFAERSDISEETTRLDSHLRQAADLLKSKDPAGKPLDFLAQEMYREINTIGSKANDAGIAGHVVTFKTELERLREQVQNVE